MDGSYVMSICQNPIIGLLEMTEKKPQFLNIDLELYTDRLCCMNA